MATSDGVLPSVKRLRLWNTGRGKREVGKKVIRQGWSVIGLDGWRRFLRFRVSRERGGKLSTTRWPPGRWVIPDYRDRIAASAGKGCCCGNTRYPFTLLPGDGRGWRETVSGSVVLANLSWLGIGGRKEEKVWDEESSLESLDNYLELGKVRRVEIGRVIGLFVRIVR